MLYLALAVALLALAGIASMLRKEYGWAMFLFCLSIVLEFVYLGLRW